MKPKLLKSLAVILAVLLSGIIPAGVALADNVQADGDGVTPFTVQDAALGNISQGSSQSQSILLAIKRVGSGQVFANSATVTVSVTSSSASQATAVMNLDNTIVLPENWTSLSNNTLSTDTASSTVTVDTTGQPIGSYSATITYSASGTMSSGSSPVSGTLVVTWTVVAPPPPPPPSDTTAPVGSITINSNATYTNSTGATLNLAATDAVGVTGYRVADGTDASTASTVAVPSTTSFSANIPWTLPAGDGTKTVAVQYRDAAGNWSPNSTDSIILDQTPPTITGSRLPAANINGWNNTDVTVSFTATDVLSGIDTVSGPTTLSGEGAGQSVTGTATDKAGNSASTTVSGINIDKTKPVITITGPSPVLLGASATATVTASDALSGLAVDPSGTVALDTSTVGSKTISATATDKAGNSETIPFTYSVIYGFNGLLSPYSASKAFKLGSSIPLKWQYTDANGNVVNSAGANPGISIVKVSDSTTTDPVTLGEDSGKSGLQYDALTNTWQFNWQTKGYAVGTYNVSITSGQTGQTNGHLSIQLK